MVGVYVWCVEYLVLFVLLVDVWWVWVSVLFLYDFFYYWLYCMGYEVNIFWVVYVVYY